MTPTNGIYKDGEMPHHGPEWGSSCNARSFLAESVFLASHPWVVLMGFGGIGISGFLHSFIDPLNTHLSAMCQAQSSSVGEMEK